MDFLGGKEITSKQFDILNPENFGFTMDEYDDLGNWSFSKDNLGIVVQATVGEDEIVVTSYEDLAIRGINIDDL